MHYSIESPLTSPQIKIKWLLSPAALWFWHVIELVTDTSRAQASYYQRTNISQRGNKGKWIRSYNFRAKIWTGNILCLGWKSLFREFLSKCLLFSNNHCWTVWVWRVRWQTKGKCSNNWCRQFVSGWKYCYNNQPLDHQTLPSKLDSFNDINRSWHFLTTWSKTQWMEPQFCLLKPHMGMVYSQQTTFIIVVWGVHSTRASNCNCLRGPWD